MGLKGFVWVGGFCKRLLIGWFWGFWMFFEDLSIGDEFLMDLYLYGRDLIWLVSG